MTLLWEAKNQEYQQPQWVEHNVQTLVNILKNIFMIQKNIRKRIKAKSFYLLGPMELHYFFVVFLAFLPPFLAMAAARFAIGLAGAFLPALTAAEASFEALFLRDPSSALFFKTAA
jgi:hypothetical protein